MGISRFSIRRPVFTLVTMFLVLILGTVSLMNIPIKLIPEINPPVGVVVVNYGGASPHEVLERVTKPLEASLSTLPGLDTMTSTSQENANFTLLEFTWSSNIDELESDIQARIDQTPLPEEADKPRFMKFDPAQFPIIQLSLRGEEDQKALQGLAENLRRELNKVNGIANVSMSGTITEEVKIELDQNKLKAFMITQHDVVSALRGSSVSSPGEHVLAEGKELTARVISSIHSLEDIKNIKAGIDQKTGQPIQIKDIAKVGIAPESEDTITRANREPALLLSVMQQSDANTASVSEAFQEKLEKLKQKKVYKNIQSDILFDQGDYIRMSIGNMRDTLILGGILAMSVLFLFLRSVASPFIIGISIPYSVVVTFVLMYFSGFTLNIMTLGGLALGIGMLVDNSIVVIENIYRHLSMGKKPKDAAMEGAKEVSGAITASTLTSVAVFLPVVFITGIIGELFTEFALTIAFSLFASLAVALTVVPMLASKWLKPSKGNREEERRNSAFFTTLDKAVRGILHHRIPVLFITLLLLAGSVYALSKAGREFLPKSDEGFFTIGVRLENGSALGETEKAVRNIEKLLSDKREVDVFVSLIGMTQEDSFRGMGKANEAEIYVKLQDKNLRDKTVFQFTDDIKKQLQAAAKRGNETAATFINLQSTSGSAPNTLVFSVKDYDEQRLNKAADKIHQALEKLPDINQVTTDREAEVEELEIVVDREKAFAQGFAPAQIGMMVKDATRGVDAIQISAENEQLYTVHAGYEKTAVQTMEKLKGLLLRRKDGQYVKLGQVADIQIGTSPAAIQRIDQQSAVQFTLKYKSHTNLGKISKKVEETMDSLNLAGETEIVFGGDKKLLDSTLDDMIFAFILAVVLVYLVMAAQFESFKYPFVIMFSIPLIAVGIAIGLGVTNTPIGLTAVIGIIVLAGIVVNNAIVIVDYINQRKSQGFNALEALVEAVKDRLRPIVMTALTTILGLIPLALGIGEGAEFNQPMGITVIGGLISSTLLTLFIIPIIYSLVDRDARRLIKEGNGRVRGPGHLPKETFDIPPVLRELLDEAKNIK